MTYLPDVQAKFIAEMKLKFKFEILPAKGPKEAVTESDLVVTSGPILKHPTPSIEKDWLKPGGFGSAVDFDSYWTGPAMAQMDKVSTDDHAQFEYYHTSRIFSTHPRLLMRTWDNWQPVRNLGGDLRRSEPWRSTWGWPWMIWLSHRKFTGGQGKRESAPGCRYKRLGLRNKTPIRLGVLSPGYSDQFDSPKIVINNRKIACKSG